MKHIKLFEGFITERGRQGMPKMYVKYMAVMKKVKELEELQKELAKPYFDAKEAGDEKAAKSNLEKLKKNQRELDAFRRNLANIEDKYINSMDYFSGEDSAE